MLSSTDTSTIRIGIDLGTTNSSIALNDGGEIEVVRNVFGEESTPSVFGVDKAGNVVVGKKAYERLYKTATDEERDNYKGEVKRLMGTSDAIRVERLGKSLTPEEVSAEILKSLKADVQRTYPDLSLFSAVITVPAMFETMQNEATKRAGQLAGFDHVILLQEPIAAAIAYGFENHGDETWLVYDFGGGTFDAAVISSEEGLLSVMGHYGDNFSGGKDIDEVIVEQVIKPRLVREFDLRDFDKAHYFTAHAKLKAIAENAKIELSTYDKVSVEVEGLGVKDARGRDVSTSFILTRKEFEDLIAPIVDKTMRAVERTIEDAGIAKGDISRTILVGGTTLIPYVRERIRTEVGAPVDTSVNPLTIVARGAAIYAMGQRVPDEVARGHKEVADASAVAVTLNYDAMTSDDDQLVTGTLDVASDKGLSVQISSRDGFYSSGRVPLKNKSFVAIVDVQHGKTTTYDVQLFDASGSVVPIDPSSFSITHGLSVGGAPISHGIGVVYSRLGADGSMSEACDPYFDRTRVPPLRETRSYRTVRTLRRGETNSLPVKVYEGDSDDPELNLILTRLEISGDRLPFDLREGTDVDITIKVDESRGLTVEAYIPDIDLELDARVDMTYQEVDAFVVEEELDRQDAAVSELSSFAPAERVSQIHQELDAARASITDGADTDAKQKAVRDLRDIKAEIVELKRSTEGEAVSRDLDEAVSGARGAIEMFDDESQKRSFSRQVDELERMGRDALRRSDLPAARSAIEQLGSLTSSMYMLQPAWWVYVLRQFENGTYAVTDEWQRRRYVDEGHAAARNGDLDGLKDSVIHLIRLMPDLEQSKIPAGLAGITK